VTYVTRPLRIADWAREPPFSTLSSGLKRMVRFSRNAKKGIAMKTRYDDIATALIGVAFCFVSASMVIATLVGAA
jgi:hypothetical protein